MAAIAAKPSIARNEGKNKFHTHAERDAFLHAFVANDNRTRLKCLDYRAPAELISNPPGPNTKAGTQITFSGGLRFALAGTRLQHVRPREVPMAYGVLGPRLRGDDVGE